jgi:hypothetical protein
MGEKMKIWKLFIPLLLIAGLNGLSCDFSNAVRVVYLK